MFDISALLFALQNVIVEMLSRICSQKVFENDPKTLKFDVLPLV